MNESCVPETQDLDPAYSLVYCGLSENAAMDKLRVPLSRMLDVSPPNLLKQLEQKPLFLGISKQRDRLENQQARLTDWGCKTQLEAVWRYRHWTLSDGLVEILKILGKQNNSSVFALIYVKPAPGISVLHKITEKLPCCDAYCLNHGQVLLQLATEPDAGAGRLLKSVQEQLEQDLQQTFSDTPHLMLSALALYPFDADTPGALLDALSARLIHSVKDEAAKFGPDDPSQVLSRQLAGRPWIRLVENQLNEYDAAKLEPEEQMQLRLNWPLTQTLKPEFGGATPKHKIARFLSQFEAGSLKRVDRCWELLRDSQSWDNLPSLPEVALEIYNLTQDDESTADELNRLVSRDPALATRILSLVNSSYYGLKQKVDSLSHALIILGRQEVAELALLISSESVFQGPSPAFGHKLWRHSAMTAEITRALAHKLNWPKPSALYTSALLHDAGKILLYNAYQNEMQELERIAKSNHLPMYEMEREYFGHDHATLGAIVLRRWGLPEYICRRVEAHHGPLPGEEKMSETAALIGVADHLAHRLVSSEQWANNNRLRRVHALSLESELGNLSMDEINQLLDTHGVKLRSQRL